jgi:hypothetical protein
VLDTTMFQCNAPNCLPTLRQWGAHYG